MEFQNDHNTNNKKERTNGMKIKKAVRGSISFIVGCSKCDGDVSEFFIKFPRGLPIEMKGVAV